MGGEKAVRFGAGVVLVLASVWLLSCRLQREQPTGGRPECPMTQVALADTTDTVVAISGPITNIPEFHDCQRFVVGKKYDSLYAIFAGYHLELSPNLRLTPAQINPPSGSSSTAIGPTGANKAKPPLNQISLEGTGYTYAEIYTWGGNYPPLGIKPGFNCLYLFVTGGQQRARMVPIANLPTANQDSSCIVPRPDMATNTGYGKELLVRQDTEPGLTADDYPPVARWDWDAVHLKQYIGIRCGSAWCEIGDSDLVVSTALGTAPSFATVSGDPPTPNETLRVTRIKGWYDRQQLATKPWFSPLQPGAVWGTIIPNPALGRKDHDDVSYFHPTTTNPPWVEVAVVRVPEDYSMSVAKFANGDNSVALCYGTTQECQVDDSKVSGCKTSAIAHSSYTGSVTPATPLWWVRITAEGTSPQFRCVEWRDHSADALSLGYRIPGTARWRWLLEDETTWARCTEGCCEMH